MTWRLAGSLPANLLGTENTEAAGRVFVAVDRRIDRAACGPVWLKDARIAQLVSNALQYGDPERHFYSLKAWVIMPNHVHLLLQPKVPLPAITRWLKGSTARRANQLLGRTGQAFWQDESFDHWIRDEREFNQVVRYIEYNPVSAGLVLSPSDWRWSSAWQAGESACPTITQSRTDERL